LNPGNDWSLLGGSRRCCDTGLSDDEKGNIPDNYQREPQRVQDVITDFSRFLSSNHDIT